ncbi:MAG: T9SS type A sorting domain-containing protein [Bacteroidia bacterium]
MKKLLLSLSAILFNTIVFAQTICNPTGNVVLFSNYDGGQLDINVDVNIPNLKIGVVSYEPVAINLSGTFVNNVSAVRFAGYVTTTNNHCTNTPPQTIINGAPAGTDTIIFMPSSPVPNPNGYYIIICNYSCDTANNQGGCNTPDQIAAYFIQEFGGQMRFHYTQYGCWTGTHLISAGGNCCVGATSVVVPPVAGLQSSDTTFCEKLCLDFTDLSSNSPTTWQWFFPGADSTTSSLQNPTYICYNNYGSFDVTLIACNSGGCDTITKTNFINEYPEPYDSIWQSNDTLYSLPAATYQWYETTSGLITGATSQAYVTTMAGNYYCLITDSIGCIGNSNTIAITTGITTVSANIKTVIQPNPFNNEITVSIEKLNLKNVQLILKNSLGQTVISENGFANAGNFKTTLSTTNLSKGIYLLQIIIDGQMLSNKIIKE